MSRSRRSLALGALLFSLSALAGYWADGPPGLRSPRSPLAGQSTALRPSLGSGVRGPAPRQGRVAAPPTARISGPIEALRVLDLAGVATEVEVPPGLDLSDPLPLPAGVFAEIEVDLAGPVAVTLPLSRNRRFFQEVDRLTVVIADPDAAAEAGALRLDLTGLETEADLAAALDAGLIGE